MLRTLAVALALLAVAAPSAAAHSSDAEIFATDNTAVITDPDDPRLDDRLHGFAHRVTRIVDEGGGRPRGSQLLDGVFFGDELTFERSRRFDVDDVSDAELHGIAETIRRRFLQQSVLTFDHLHPADPDVNAVELEVPGVSARDLQQGLVDDQEARERLFGGSVTLDRRLLLVAALEDAQFARGFAKRIGGRSQARPHELRRARVRGGRHRRPRADREAHAAHHRHAGGRPPEAARGPPARDRLRRRRRDRLRGLAPPVRPPPDRPRRRRGRRRCPRGLRRRRPHRARRPRPGRRRARRGGRGRR